MNYDLILKNANVITMDPELSRCTWLAIKDGKISALGSDECSLHAEEVLDLAGATILPGLMDCHVHVLLAGLQLNAVDLQQARTINEVLNLLERKAVSTEDEEWVFGVNYVPQNIEGERYPTRWEMDSISHGHKMMILAATLHASAVNTLGLQVANVDDNLPGVDKKNGEVTGIFSSDESSFVATKNVFSSLSDDKLWKLIKDCANEAVSKGVTTMHGLFGQFVEGDKDLHLILEKNSSLPLEMVVFYQTWNVQEALDLRLPRVGGCLTLDGALFEYTMANYEPFHAAPALRGVLYHNDDEVYQVVSKAHAANIQCTLHALGERAIDQLLYIYRRVFIEQGRKDLRHRIEHFCLPTEDQIMMAKDLDLIISMQPGFTYLWDKAEGGEFEYVLGRERADRWDPFNRIIDAGITVCGGSDCPVTKIEPLIDIATCVNGNNPVRNISVTDALKMYTINAAYAANLEKTKGSLEVGKDADVVVIDRDPYEIADQQSIYDIQVLYTINNGKVVYVHS